MTKFARIIAGLLAVLLLAGACVQLLGAVAYAASTLVSRNHELVSVKQYNGSTTSYIGQNLSYTIEFECTVDVSGTSAGSILASKGTATDLRISSGNRTTWQLASSAKLTYDGSLQQGSSTVYDVNIIVENITYKSSNKNTTLSLTANLDSNVSLDISFDLPAGYFSRGDGGGDGGGTGTNPYSSNIVIENVLVRDKDDKTLDTIDKDTPPFTIDIVYADFGLRETDDDLIDSAEMDAYMLETGGFTPGQGTKGTIRSILRGSNDVPRFRATFSGVTWDGTSSTISFRVQYVIDGWYVDGEANARVYAAKVEDEEDDDDTAPPTPYIIINRYGIGAEAIEAGASFTLDMAFSNTSTEIDLENIVMTISPIATSATEGMVPISIASSSNTYYYTTLPANGSIAQAIDLNVRPDSSVGSAGVQINFEYEYVVDKKRESNKTSVDIAIPITQIDRFAVDPITSYDSWMETGREGWVEVSFVNRGKSTTYNVSGYVLNEDGTPGQTEHHGNLEAGAHGTLDFSPIFNEPGEKTVTIVIQYEDQNSEIKELSESYTVFVEEPWYGGWEPDDPGMWEDPEPEPAGLPAWKTALLSVGGLAIAAPIALYVTMRVRAKGSEDFDEDF